MSVIEGLMNRLEQMCAQMCELRDRVETLETDLANASSKKTNVAPSATHTTPPAPAPATRVASTPTSPVGKTTTK